ncbi:DUF4267 domain-containing protein [Sorangium sp. So ce295]|uniref:DUF4267 domain-containing protein n=1 Tax=Sorangium sp. So ce295 TaxID=3133295 RepID=UPI003F612609
MSSSPARAGSCTSSAIARATTTSCVAPSAASFAGSPLAGLAAYAVAKGARDLSVGASLIAFTLLGERRAAALALLLGSVIPVVDGAIVLAWRGAHPGYLAIHWGTAVFCVALGALQLRRRT